MNYQILDNRDRMCQPGKPLLFDMGDGRCDEEHNNNRMNYVERVHGYYKLNSRGVETRADLLSRIARLTG